MDRLWSPWRLEYVTRADDTNRCIFCPDVAGATHPPSPGFGATRASLLPPEQEALVVFRGTVCFIILNLYPYNNGHLMVAPVRHVAALSALTNDELQEMALLTQRCETALYEAYQPHGINVGINLGKTAGAGVLDHIHVHVVPRWNGDTNFMTVVGEMRVLPESLGDSAARLRPIFTRLGSTSV